MAFGSFSFGGGGFNVGSIAGSVKNVISKSEITSEVTSKLSPMKEKVTDFISTAKDKVNLNNSEIVSTVGEYKNDLSSKVKSFINNNEKLSSVKDAYNSITDYEKLYQDYMNDTPSQLDELTSEFDLDSMLDMESIKNFMPFSEE